jgi:hypothetical protein
MDIFPRSGASQYFADMSRTIVKGKASPAARRRVPSRSRLGPHPLEEPRPNGRGGRHRREFGREGREALLVGGQGRLALPASPQVRLERRAFVVVEGAEAVGRR